MLRRILLCIGVGLPLSFIAGCGSDSSDTGGGGGGGSFAFGGELNGGGATSGGGDTASGGNTTSTGGDQSGGGAANGGTDNGLGGTSAGGTSSDLDAGLGGTTDNDGSTSSGGTSNGGTGNGGTGNGGTGNGGTGNGGTGNGGTGSGGTSSGGTGGAGGQSPFVPTGPVLTGTDKTWKYVSIPGTKCRDGSEAGIGISLNSASKKVMVYLEGGGACFDSLTCAVNPANVTGQTGAHAAGIFDRANVNNPVKDWNQVYVPYCTGDVHAGTNDNGAVPGVTGTQHFDGRTNLLAFLNRIVPTFSGASQVLLTGISAGGFGAAGNAEFVQWAFGDIPVTLIDDSGPPMSSTYIAACLQDKWRSLWGFDQSILKDCGADCPSKSDYLLNYALHVGRKFKDRPSGLIETTDDGVISAFLGYGTNNCTGSLLTPVSAQNFQAGLLDFRAQMGGVDPKFGTYYIPGTVHTWLVGAAFYTESVGGTSMVDWVTGIVNGTGAPNVGP